MRKRSEKKAKKERERRISGKGRREWGKGDISNRIKLWEWRRGNNGNKTRKEGKWEGLLKKLM